MEDQEPSRTPAAKAKASWVRPELREIGHVGTLLEGGGGKISPRADPGDGRKQKSAG